MRRQERPPGPEPNKHAAGLYVAAGFLALLTVVLLRAIFGERAGDLPRNGLLVAELAVGLAIFVAVLWLRGVRSRRRMRQLAQRKLEKHRARVASRARS